LIRSQYSHKVQGDGSALVFQRKKFIPFVIEARRGDEIQALLCDGHVRRMRHYAAGWMSESESALGFKSSIQHRWNAISQIWMGTVTQKDKMKTSDLLYMFDIDIDSVSERFGRFGYSDFECLETYLDVKCIYVAAFDDFCEARNNKFIHIIRNLQSEIVSWINSDRSQSPHIQFLCLNTVAIQYSCGYLLDKQDLPIDFDRDLAIFAWAVGIPSALLSQGKLTLPWN
jgi:hypothetical protein